MRNSLAIAEKELRTYFVSPLAYVVATGFLLLTGVFFFSLVTQFQRMVSMAQSFGRHDMLEQISIESYIIAPILGNMSVIFVLLVPILTMPLLALEKKLKTDELLFTSPVTVGEIVAGKFLGAWALVMGLLAATAIYPFILSQYAEPDLGPILSGYLGIGLMATSFVAIGLFASSLTDNQVVAGVLGFVIILLLYIISWPAEFLSSSVVGEVFAYLSVISHFENLSKGVVELRDLVYFVSLIGFFLILTRRSLDSSRSR